MSRTFKERQKVAKRIVGTDEVVVANIPKRVGVMILQAKGFTWFVLNCVTTKEKSEGWFRIKNKSWNAYHEEPYESRGSRTVLWEVWGWNSPLPTRRVSCVTTGYKEIVLWISNITLIEMIGFTIIWNELYTEQWKLSMQRSHIRLKVKDVLSVKLFRRIY
jgi:hypothetical protein